MIREAKKTGDDFNTIMALMETYEQNPLYDCTFQEFQPIFLEAFKHPHLRAWLAFSDMKPIGYIIASRQYLPKNEINIIQVYATETGFLHDLLDEIKQWALKTRPHRVSWSSEHDERTWERIMKVDLKQKYSIEWRVS